MSTHTHTCSYTFNLKTRFFITEKEVRLNAPGADDTDNMQIHRSVSDAKDLRALARKAAKMKDRDFGKAIIYFGCRNSRMDHIYKEELEKCKMAGALDEVYVAFSRDKEVMEKVCTLACDIHTVKFKLGKGLVNCS